MTTITEALNTLSTGLAELAEALNEPGSGTAPRPAAGVAGTSPAPASFSDGLPVEEPPEQWEEFAPAPSTPTRFAPPAPTPQDLALAECPVHFRPWTVKEGGISRNGKPYSAFWKCNGKNDDGSYCSKKPDKGWVKTHDPEKALAAA